MKRIVLALALVALRVWAAPPASGLDAERLARIPARMKAFVECGSIAGAVMLVARHGTVGSVEAVGYQNLETKTPMRTDTIFQIMSMSKPVTAIGIMMLLEEGRLGLNDPVERHLLEFRGQWVIDNRPDEKTRLLKKSPRPITIKDLLTHTSGMAAMAPEGMKEVMFKFDHTLAEAVTVYSQQPLEFEPGKKWSYSNTGIATLGRIIEVVSGMPYEKFMEERIFKPLGMKDSFFFPPEEKKARIAMLYKLEDGHLKRAGAEALAGDAALYRKGAKYPCPECGMYSTATDLAALYQMMLNGGVHQGKQLLSRASVEAMTAVQTGELRPSYGLGWAVSTDPGMLLSLKSQGTFGHGGAFGTYGWMDPKKDLLGVFLIQRTAGGTDAESNAFQALAGAAAVD
jgi:CubicO group peptidase (beta-lactamase class C family)